jgi:hypothetical protein
MISRKLRRADRQQPDEDLKSLSIKAFILEEDF